MKTAKEVCEELEENKLNDIIDSVVKNNGVALLYWNHNNLDSEMESTLISLGYKIEKGIESRTIRSIPKYKDKVITSKFLWFKTNKIIKEHDGYDDFKVDISYIKISACCGDE
jgi:Holliday junction resolvasome RuvABC DNA-binding subunit